MHSNGNTPPLVIDFQTVRELEDGREGPRDRWNKLVFLFFFFCQFENSFKLGNSRSNSFDRFNRSTTNPRLVIEKNQESIEEEFVEEHSFKFKRIGNKMNRIIKKIRNRRTNHDKREKEERTSVSLNESYWK